MSSSSSSSPEMSAAPGVDPQASFSYKDSTHEEVLDELSSRFILNLPPEELQSLERVCFQVEQAHWFYEDFIREENPKFPSLPLKKFSAMLFNACPLLHQWRHDHEQAFNTFMQYKTRVPVCGAIMLNASWDKCVLVKGWKSSSGWGFPKGKINEEEPPPTCAVREVLEETGYNLAGQLDPQDVIEVSIKQQKISLYIVPGVPEDFPFKTKTRKEISKIEWFKLTDLPTWRRNKAVPGKFYLISPFIGSLKAFIQERKPRNPPRKSPKAKKIASDINGNSQKNNPRTGDNEQSQSLPSNGESDHHPFPSQYTSNAFKDVLQSDDKQLSISSQSMDPHFARLLSSLTMSASVATNSDNKFEDTGGATGLATESHTTPMSSTISISAVKSSNRSPTPIPTTLISKITNSAQSLPSSHPQELPRMNPRMSPSPFGPHIGDASMRESKLHSLVSPINSAVSPVTSPFSARTTSSRRTSSTADISPYLSRPAEVPASAKRLQQLALLEAIADESARITPIIVSRSNALMANGIHNLEPPLPPSSVPPPSMSFQQPDPRIFYASSAQNGVGLSLHPYNLSPLGSSNFQDAFQSRARTSQAFHRSPLQPHANSVSMNQGQLLAMMNDSRAPLGPPPNSYYQTSLANGRYPPFYNDAPIPVTNSHPLPFGQRPADMYDQYSTLETHTLGSPNMNITSALHPVSGLPTKASQTADALLFILNGNRPVAGISGVPSSQHPVNPSAKTL